MNVSIRRVDWTECGAGSRAHSVDTSPSQTHSQCLCEWQRGSGSQAEEDESF